MSPWQSGWIRVDWLSLFCIRAHQRLPDDVHILECLQTVAAPTIHPGFTRQPPPSTRTSVRTAHANGKRPRTPPPPSPPLCICPVLSSIIRPIKVCKVERWRANTHVPLFGRSLAFVLVPAHLPLICRELVDRGHFWISGQLHQIQKDIRGPPPPSSLQQ